jgi:hypothetical protein
MSLFSPAHFPPPAAGPKVADQVSGARRQAGDSNDRAAPQVDEDEIADQFQEVNRRRAVARSALAIGEEGRPAIVVFLLIVPDGLPERGRTGSPCRRCLGCRPPSRTNEQLHR